FPEHPSASFRGYGHYNEEYVREDGGWRIRRLVLTRLRVDPLTDG
ncbi:MAG: nuclear transport factor 2 family protein, partial [Acidimicrobiia bacterium]|nr:nuclear transport factor 2 family protein [Acidimicrobiia bacterium]